MFRLHALLTVLAILSLASMPFGYMPDRAGEGSFVLRICDGRMPVAQMRHTSQTASQHGDHAQQDDGMSDDHQMRCNYAVAGLFSMPDAPLLVDRVALALAEESLPHRALTGIFPPHLPPSTGPPSV